jgi:toxin ParE1/3/4
MKIIWTPQAREDLNEILDYLEKISPKYAADFDEKIHTIIYTLKDHPFMGRMIPEIKDERLREKIVGKYRLMYFLKDDEWIHILALYHGSREFIPY